MKLITYDAEKIRAAMESWSEWSPAERRKLDSIHSEVMSHLQDGSGNAFVATFCNSVLPKLLMKPEQMRLDAIQWLVENDHDNGIYTDVDSIDNGYDPMTLAEAVALRHEIEEREKIEA